jgi:hypothetical protein
MRPVSDAFLTTVRSSYSMVARARVCETYQTGTDPDGTSIEIYGGDVVIDGTADIRSTLSLDTTGVAMWPTRTNRLLAPYGNEVFVERGVQYGNGTREWVSLGYFRIVSPDQGNPPDGPISLTCADRMKGIVRARLLNPVQFLPTDTFGSAVSSLVLDVYPLATIEWDDATNLETLGRTVAAEDDRYACLVDLVTSRGKIFYWDHRGVLVIKDLPSATDPVYDITAGRGGVLVAASRTLTSEGVYNAVVATGEAGDETPPARGVAYDANPDSPTYFYGPFGQCPRFYSSPLLFSDDAATQAARTILGRELGLPYNVSFSAICNPALEPYDAVRVRYSNRSGAETHVIESITIPLTADAAMSGTTREQTLTTVGTL